MVRHTGGSGGEDDGLEEGVQRGSTTHVTEEPDPAGVRGPCASSRQTCIEGGLETGSRPGPADPSAQASPMK